MIETFLTAFDPSDLPGTSVDPLGFERGYLLLADKLLPGLTNVAARPRYFALLCAGIQLSGESSNLSELEKINHRKEVVLRLERFWALANVLFDAERSGGVRGVSYAREFRTDLLSRSQSRTTANYRLLSRQSQYGAIGMYANVADGMHFFNREDFILTPALGEVAAEAFCNETEMPNTLRRAIVEDSDVALTTLSDWGERAHVEAEIKPGEAACLHEALHATDLRSRMATLLLEHPSKNDSEMARLARIVRRLKKVGLHDDLREAGDCTLSYEACYQHVQLALERLLWLCRHHSRAAISVTELADDPVFTLVRKDLPAHTRHLLDCLDQGSTAGFRENLDRLADVRRFLETISGVCEENSAFIDVLIARHTDIQHGKFDRSRRKMPWLERNGSLINLTMTRAGGLNRSVFQPDEIAPHPYRFGAADALNFAAQQGVRS